MGNHNHTLFVREPRLIELSTKMHDLISHIIYKVTLYDVLFSTSLIECSRLNYNAYNLIIKNVHRSIYLWVFYVFFSKCI
jgi:hypothetical protein